jgi:transposase
VAEKEVALKPLTESQARELVAKIQNRLMEVDKQLGDMIIKAYTGQAWLGMGYESWEDLCESEFPRDQYRLRVSGRRELNAYLREAGMSIRAIAKATNVSKTTVQADSKVAEQDHSGVPKADTSVQGQDGKLYKATKPKATPKKKDDHYDWEADKVELVQPKPVDLPSSPRVGKVRFTLTMEFEIEVNLDSEAWAWAKTLEDAVKEETERIKAEPEAYLGSDHVIQISQKWL